MPRYDHKCDSCGYEFEDTYSIYDSPPTICPKCKENSVRRMIGFATAGKVELSGDELKQKVLSDAKDFKKQVMKDEKLLANLVGEQKYEAKTKDYERKQAEFKGVFRRK